MASGSHFLLLLCLTSGLLAAASSCKEKKTEDSCPDPCCPSGWTRLGNRCFIFYYQSRDWVDAEKFCLTIGGNLASIHNDKEEDFLRNLVQRVSGSYRTLWVGGFDSIKEGVWQWSDGSTFQYSRWYTGQPSNTAGKEHCLVMNYGGSYWNDYQCTYRYPFVCSMNM